MPRRYKQMKGLTYRAERALRKCLREKWDYLARGEEPETLECALCVAFVPADAGSTSVRSCRKCPVRHRTGRRDCADTPYWDWHCGHSKERRIAAAKAERRFLLDTLRLGLRARERAKAK